MMKMSKVLKRILKGQDIYFTESLSEERILKLRPEECASTIQRGLEELSRGNQQVQEPQGKKVWTVLTGKNKNQCETNAGRGVAAEPTRRDRQGGRACSFTL